MKVVLAGGTGALGRRLADDLRRQGADVVILTRRPHPDLDHRQVEWDGRTVGPWASELSGAVLVNLAGKLVDCRPTARNIALLTRSRVEPTRALVRASAGLAIPPGLWLQMSTLAIYGDAGDDPIDEQHPPADGPPQMPGVARPWEAALEGAVADRIVVLRTGLVLDAGTPAFDRLATLTRFGLGGQISRGDQWVSWIHVDDYLRAIHHICGDPTLHGVVHVTAPAPIRNRDMMAALRRALHRPWSPPTPKPLVHLGAWFMGSDPALALTGRRCLPTRLAASGFRFEHPALPAALPHLLARNAGGDPAVGGPACDSPPSSTASAATTSKAD
jgi:uncharacterized protein (TIGR01777 family)